MQREEREKQTERKKRMDERLKKTIRFLCVHVTSALPELNYRIDTRRGNFIMSYRCLHRGRDGDDSCCHLTWHDRCLSETDKMRNKQLNWGLQDGDEQKLKQKPELLRPQAWKLKRKEKRNKSDKVDDNVMDQKISMWLTQLHVNTMQPDAATAAKVQPTDVWTCSQREHVQLIHG